MFHRYREIFYGLLFGLGACAIDIVMHSRMADRDLSTELFQPELAMLFYRGLFIVFGLTVGLLLWQRSKREREFRVLADTLERFHHDIVSPAVLMHAKLQLLLTRDEFHLSPEVGEAVRFLYDRSQQIQSAARESLPPIHK